MAEFKIKMPPQSPEASGGKAIIEGLMDGNEDFKELLIFELQRLHRPQGSPEIKNLRILPIKGNQDSGSFRALYDIEYTYACEDAQTYKPDQTSDWRYCKDDTGDSLIFSSAPYEEPRSTIDEF